ncbi:MAG: hypothetical protein ACRD1C_07720 [Terriglobales bacterium]
MNYFNYFTEIEEHFQRKRGAQYLLSPVDWALIASWREAGIPLAAVLAGIDEAFEKFESGRRRDTQRHRALVYCAPAVRAAADAAQTAAVGAASTPVPPRPEDDAFSPLRIRAHLENAAACLALALPGSAAAADVLATLRRLATSVMVPGSLEELDRLLSACDDKLLAILTAATSVEVMVAVRTDLERDLAPYRRQLRAEQLAMIERQFLQRRLLDRWRIPRLSLFYLNV